MVYIYVTKCYHVVFGNKERAALYFKDKLFARLNLVHLFQEETSRMNEIGKDKKEGSIGNIMDYFAFVSSILPYYTI